MLLLMEIPVKICVFLRKPYMKTRKNEIKAILRRFPLEHEQKYQVTPKNSVISTRSKSLSDEFDGNQSQNLKMQVSNSKNSEYRV